MYLELNTIILYLHGVILHVNGTQVLRVQLKLQMASSELHTLQCS